MKQIVWPGWKTIRLLGFGSYGKVYEIERQVFGRTERAALKVISLPHDPNEIAELRHEGYDYESISKRFRSFLEDIAAEYTLMAEMKGHSNIVNCDDIHYIQHEDGIGWDIYIKMELLTPLVETLQNNCSDQTVLRVGKDICRALLLCKSRNIIHRDIKPQNIFVSRDGDYKLGDFGIAKTVEKTSCGTKIGTFKYMAPEVYNNRPYDFSADIYSLGMVLYWMLNERRAPFLPLPPQVPNASMEEESRHRRFIGEPLPPPAHGSPALKSVVLKACAYDPKTRFATAEEFLAALEAIQVSSARQGKNTAMRMSSDTQNDKTTLLQRSMEPDNTLLLERENPATKNEWTTGIAAEQRNYPFAETAFASPKEAENYAVRSHKRAAVEGNPVAEQNELPQTGNKKWKILGFAGMLFVVAIILGAVIFALASPDADQDINQNTGTNLTATDGSEEHTEEQTVENASCEFRIALITECGEISQGSFSENAWRGVQNFCDENNTLCAVYRSQDGTVDEHVAAIERAAADGYNVIVASGYSFGKAFLACQDRYPSVYFIGTAVDENDLLLDGVMQYPSENVTFAAFAEEQAGYLAGYAAVNNGYTKLGFLGSLPAPSIVRYGYGFVQGADAAAKERNVATEVCVNYAYGSDLGGDNLRLTETVTDWYINGTEVIFACCGEEYTELISNAAVNTGGAVIGVDTDQRYIGTNVITSAMKNIEQATYDILCKLAEGKWSQLGGESKILSLRDGDYLGLPTTPESWRFTQYTEEQYYRIVEEFREGRRTCANTIDEKPITDIVVDYQMANQSVANVTEQAALDAAAERQLKSMTLEEKLYQLFFVSVDALSGNTQPMTVTRKAQSILESHSVGGIIFEEENILSRAQLKSLIPALQECASVPLFVGVTEESGAYAPLAEAGMIAGYEPMQTYGERGDAAQVYSMAIQQGQSLRDLGFNLNFAPVADTRFNSNSTIGLRSFGSNPQLVAEMVEQVINGLQDSQIIACAKHFPGYGSSELDETGAPVVCQKSLQELQEGDILPFERSIDADTGMIMVSSIYLPQVAEDGASSAYFSVEVVTKLLRDALGYDGVIITDAMHAYYIDPFDAVRAIQAGCDMILEPSNFEQSVAVLRAAVENGTISEERIDESVLRILKLKYRFHIE
ncbi:MAG: glycoside hydrolase family 3 N-terminal domain-containing protein [Faecousia sp.]